MQVSLFTFESFRPTSQTFLHAEGVKFKQLLLAALRGQTRRRFDKRLGPMEDHGQPSRWGKTRSRRAVMKAYRLAVAAAAAPDKAPAKREMMAVRRAMLWK